MSDATAHIGFVTMLCLFHRILAHSQVRYFVMHALFNAWVVFNVMGDFCYTLTHPTSTYAVSRTIIVHMVVFHLYHLVLYDTTDDDKVHHIVNVFLICPLLLLHPTNVAHFAFFFMCGFPGLLTYILLVLVKWKYITKGTEKCISLHVNMWMRAPGIVVACYLIGLNFVATRHVTVAIAACIVLLASLWNGMHYLRSIIISEHTHALKHRLGAVQTCTPALNAPSLSE